MCVDFLYKLAITFRNLRRIQRDITINLNVKYTLFCQMLIKLAFFL
jgi:hypothetical protein